jgi:hypothetical protein
MNIGHLSRPARRFLSERLDRLHNALESLGQRLREGIAHLVGSHIGEAVQDALKTVLLSSSASRTAQPRYDPGRYPSDDYYQREQNFHTQASREDFWADPEPVPEPLPPPPEEPRQPSRWRSVLVGSVHLATVWYRHRPQRRSVLRFLGLGAIAALVTLAAGSLVGGIVATVGTAVLLTRTADTATKAAQTAAELPAN